MLASRFCNASVFVCIFIVFAIPGCGQSGIKEAPFHDLPQIDRLTKSQSSRMCVYLRSSSPHTVWVRVLGEARSQADLITLFPFLEGKETYPEAQLFCSRMGDELSTAAQRKGGFCSTDRYWRFNEGEGGLPGLIGYIALSESSQIFYLEYSWSQ